MSEQHSRKYFLMLFAATSFAILLLIPATSLSKTITSIASESFAQKAEAISVKDYDAMKNCTTDTSKQPTSIEYLTFFNCGRVSESQDGQTVREFTLIVSENKTVDIMDGGYKFKAWTFNGTVPGPTMRVTGGDLVRITLINPESNTRSHSLHMHSIHPAAMDGVEGEGIVAPGKSFTYEFVAQPFGVYPYHCHVAPVADHVNRGLYGMLIIDLKEPRPQMHEMAMLMNGYDLNFD